MPFQDRPTGINKPTGPGVAYNNYGTIYTFTDFEEGLIVGRFCQIVSSSVDPIGRAENINGSADPVIGGVVKRNVANAIEDENTVKTFSQVDILKTGPVTVEAMEGEAPTFKAAVYIRNSNDADAGKASIDSTDNVEANAEFICKISDATWLVELK